jgi:hypothetical protein
MCHDLGAVSNRTIRVLSIALSSVTFVAFLL